MSEALARGSGSRRIVRAPNHLGDVVLALPALIELGADVMVLRALAPIVAMAAPNLRVTPLDRGPAGWRRAVRTLRDRRYEEGVLMSAAFSAAWLFRWGGVSALRGSATDGRSWLLRERVSRAALRPHHRINQFRLLAGLSPDRAPAPVRLSPDVDEVRLWKGRLASADGRLIGLFPGANAPARRWRPSGFADLARALAGRGARVVVLGGKAERELVGQVADRDPRIVDLGGKTDLSDLAAVLSLCDVLVTNDTGPMHLAGALGTPTVSLWGPSDPNEVRQLGSRDVRVTGPELPCKPCYRNRCRRQGEGTYLPQAFEECMATIEQDAVARAIEEIGERDPDRSGPVTGGAA